MGEPEESDQVVSITLELEPIEREKTSLLPNVNFEERGQKLFNIVKCSNSDQAKNLKDLNDELRDLSRKEVTKICQIIDEDKNTLLHCAAKAGNLNICQILVSSGADISATGQNGMKVLPFAARYGDEKRADEVWRCMSWIASQIPAEASNDFTGLEKRKSRRAVKQGSTAQPKDHFEVLQPEDQEKVIFNFVEKDQYNFTILHHAIQNTNWVTNPIVVKKLISTGNFPITEIDNQGNTCLHLAAQLDKHSGDKIFDAFIEDNHIRAEEISKCIEKPNDRGMTPLHIVCQVGNEESLKELLEFFKTKGTQVGQILNLPDKNGLTPLSHAVKCENLGLVTTLLHEGALPTSETVLTAARIGHVDIMKALTTHLGSSLTVEKSSLLSAAAEHSKIEMVAHLMNSDLDFERTSVKSNATPFMRALREGNTQILRVLMRGRENINNKAERDNQNKNMLHYALDSRKPVEASKFLKAALTCTPLDPSMDMGMNTEIKELLSVKDNSKDTPLHLLAKRNLCQETFTDLFTELQIVLGDLMGVNASNETPLHVAAKEGVDSFIQAVLTLGEGDPKLEELLLAKDKDSNTPLHLVTQKKRPIQSKSPLLIFLKRTRDPMKYFSAENTFGETPFNEAVKVGDTATVKKLLKDLTSAEKRDLIDHEDRSKKSPLHLAAGKGFVATFNLLLDSGADINKRGPDQKNALEIAIEKNQHEVIESIIESSQWEEAFKQPCSTKQDKLDTPLRMLIRQIPDLAEKVLDKCCDKQTVVEEQNGGPGNETHDTIQMNFSLIEDSDNYSFDKKNKKFLLRSDSIDGGKEKETTEESPTKQVDIENHPLIIMANEKRIELLEHPVCSVVIERKWSVYGRTSYLLMIFVYVIFLAALTTFILTSPSPIDPENFNCTDFIREMPQNLTKLNDSSENATKAPDVEGGAPTSQWNVASRAVLIVFFYTRAAFFFWYGEFSPLLSELKKIKRMILQREILQCPNIPHVVVDFLIYSLAVFLTHSQSSCSQWQVGAVTITLAWINLLLHMRLLNTIGIYIIVFEDVILTFLKIAVVFVILLVGFALSFHILLSHRQEFENYYDALLKTVIMMSGEIEYGEIFFKDKPPKGFGLLWDQDWFKVPFPFVTYTMFIAFVIAVTFLAFNVLVGLTVDDIRKFLGNADLRKLSMRLEFIRQMEQVEQISWIKTKKKGDLDQTVTKQTAFGAKIWREVEKRKAKGRKIVKLEEELSKTQSKIKELKEMNTNMNNLIADNKMVLKEIMSSIKDIKSSLESSQQNG